MNEIYHTADLWGFFRTILIILIVIHFLKIFARMMAPFLMRKFSKRMQQKAEDHMKQHGFNNSSNRAHKPEGTVTVEQTSSSKKSSKKSSDDDFVDYEIIE